MVFYLGDREELKAAPTVMMMMTPMGQRPHVDEAALHW